MEKLRKLTLVIDDEEGIRKLCSRALKKVDIDTEFAANAHEALDLIGNISFDLVLLDINLPDMNGLELMQKIKTVNPELPVIVFTGDASVENAVEAMKSGAIDFISKPFTLLDIRKVVQNAFEKELLRTQIDELKQLDSLKNSFMANVSHELKTPLQTMTNACEILKKKDPDNKMLDMLLRNVSRMRKLVTQLLDIALLDKKEYELSYSNFKISSFINEIIEELSEEAAKKKISVKSCIKGSDSRIEADPDALKRVFINIISNAVKYCPEGSEVTVSSVLSNDIYTFSIKDNGPGIEDREKTMVFDRFYQNDPEKSFTGKPSGLGLGLSIAKDIVNKLGGKIWLDTELGKGTEFIFSIPSEKED